MLTNNIKLPETHLITMFCLNAKWTLKKISFTVLLKSLL